MTAGWARPPQGSTNPAQKRPLCWPSIFAGWYLYSTRGAVRRHDLHPHVSFGIL